MPNEKEKVAEIPDDEFREMLKRIRAGMTTSSNSQAYQDAIDDITTLTSFSPSAIAEQAAAIDKRNAKFAPLEGELLEIAKRMDEHGEITRFIHGLITMGQGEVIKGIIEQRLYVSRHC